jgi:hypothetical protein
MISNANILYYSQMVDYFARENLKFICRPIDYPQMFNPGNLPDHVKSKILGVNSQHRDTVAHFLSLPTQSTVDAFWSEIQRQDKLKNISINDYLPELVSLFRDI